MEAVKEEEVQVEESEASGEEEAVTEEEPQPNTKLYFGNLPYNCDSSQLAGIVQEYATPEMVEVNFFFFFFFNLYYKIQIKKGRKFCLIYQLLCLFTRNQVKYCFLLHVL